MSKFYLWFISITLAMVVSLQSTKAEKFSIIQHDTFIDTDTGFINEEGKKVYLDEYEGESILLAFWATWCGACVNELASLDNLQKDFRKLPFKIIALSEDYQIDVIKQYFLDHEIRHLSIFHDPHNQLFKTLGVIGVPTAYLINSSGKLKIEFKGQIKWYDEDIRKMIITEIGENYTLPKNTFKDLSLNKQVPKKTIIEDAKINTEENKTQEGKKNEGNQTKETKQ